MMIRKIVAPRRQSSVTSVSLKASGRSWNSRNGLCESRYWTHDNNIKNNPSMR